MSSTDRRILTGGNPWPLTQLLALWAMGIFLAVALPKKVNAGDWELSSALTGSATVVDRSGENSRSGTVFRLSPRLGLSGRGSRVNANINYRPTFSAGTSDTDPEPLVHNLVAQGDVSVVENFFLLGGNAAARVSSGSSSTGSVDEISFNADGGRQTFSYGLTPQFRARLNRHVSFVSNNVLDWVTYSGDGNRAGGSGDSHSSTLHAGLRGDRRLGRLRWQTDFSDRRTHFDDRDDRRREATVGTSYVVNRKWLVRGSVGYEDNDIRTNRDDTNGVIWNVGGTWTPNPRTSVTGSYGVRYFGDVYSADVQHRAKRTSFALRLARDVSNRRSAELVDSFFFLVDEQGDILVDPETGDPIIVNIPELDTFDEDFLRTSLSGGVTVTGRRSSLSFTGTLEERSFEVSSIDEESLDFTIRFTRRISSHLTTTLRGDLSHTERDNSGDSDTYTVGVSLSRQLGRRTNASINLQHRDRSSDSSGDFTENRIGVSLTTRFL